MRRFLARIARADPLDDACLNTHALLGQALLPDFVKQSEHHRLPTHRMHHAQRGQALIEMRMVPVRLKVVGAMPCWVAARSIRVRSSVCASNKA